MDKVLAAVFALPFYLMIACFYALVGLIAWGLILLVVSFFAILFGG